MESIITTFAILLIWIAVDYKREKEVEPLSKTFFVQYILITIAVIIISVSERYYH